MKKSNSIGIKILITVLGVLIILSSTTLISSAKNYEVISVYLNGEKLTFDAQPRMIKDKAVVPFRKVLESLGAKVDWDDRTRTAIAKRGGVTIKVKIGSSEAYINNQRGKLVVVPFLANCRSMVEVRYITECLGCEVRWDDNKSAVYISTSEPVRSSYPSSSSESRLNELINEQRAKAGLGALSMDSELMNVAKIKAEDMVKNNYFDHNSPTYGSPFDLMKKFGITYRTAGENLAGCSSVEKAVELWMNSPGHRANILNGSYNLTGIGIADSPVYGKVYVQHFVGR